LRAYTEQAVRQRDREVIIHTTGRERERERERSDVDMILLKLCNKALQCNYLCSHTYDGGLMYLATHHTRYILN